MHPFFTGSILVACVLAPSISINQSTSNHVVPETFLRTKWNDGALDANGTGNAYSVRDKKFKAQWKWVTPNKATPPFAWLKWRFDSNLLIAGSPPDLETGPTGQVCLECNGSSSSCDIIVAACHGGPSQQWSVQVFAWQTERFFSIVSQLFPDRCVTVAGTLTKTEWYWDLEYGPTGSHQVKKYMTLTDSGYKLESCIDSDKQSFYVERDWNEFLRNRF